MFYFKNIPLKSGFFEKVILVHFKDFGKEIIKQKSGMGLYLVYTGILDITGIIWVNLIERKLNFQFRITEFVTRSIRTYVQTRVIFD